MFKKLFLIILFLTMSVPAMALTENEFLILMSGSQCPSVAGLKPSAYLNFQTQKYCINGSIVSLNSVLSVSRASTGYAQTAAGVWMSFGSGVPRITDQGFLIEEARTNLLLQNTAMGTSPWSVSAGGVGTVPTVTNNFSVAPDGTNTATRAQLAINGGTTSSDTSSINQNVTTTATSAYVVSVFLKSNTVSSYVVQVTDAGTGAQSNVTVTPTWQRFTVSIASAAATTGFRIRLRGGQTPTNSDSADILMWGGQVELGSFVTSPIVTAGASATRAADIPQLAGQGLVAELGAKAAFFQTYGVGGFTGYNSLFNVNNNTDGINYISATQAKTYTGTGQAIATIGSGTTSGLVKVASGFDATGLSTVANAGTKATSATADWSGLTSAFIGNISTGNRALNGYMQRFALSPTKGVFDGATSP